MEKETPYAIVATTRNGIGIIPYDSSAAAAPKCQNAGSTFRCCQTDTRKPPKREYLSNHATNLLSYTVIYLIKFSEKFIKNIYQLTFICIIFASVKVRKQIRRRGDSNADRNSG